jgi:serine protease Do
MPLKYNHKINTGESVMTTENNIWKIAEDYVNNSMSVQDVYNLEQRLSVEPIFANEFNEAVQLLRSVSSNAAQIKFKQNLNSIHTNLRSEEQKKSFPIFQQIQFWRTAAIAASAAFLATIGIHFWNNKTQENASKYSELRRVRTEIEGIKQSQSRIIKDLNSKANKPAIDNKYSGTGFALSNDGYIVTNYHVTEGADSLYIQTRDGNYYKAFTVSFDANADIAILKIESEKFKFSKEESLPYSFANAKSALGERVFTMGYPQDEIVYSEGYISSRNGYQGDSMQYRLELPAEPGQSGAPVINSNGNIIGIVAGKESKSAGITYAISSNTLLKMLRNIPQSNEISLPKTNKLGKMSRNQQIEKIQNFTCVVNVYK